MLLKKKSYQNNLSITTKKGVFSNLTGEHRSIFSGNGLDFKELREYTTGDDIRHVNWKVTARSLEPSVNIFNEDKQLNIVLVYLNAGSIFFGTKRSKKDVMIETLASLHFAALNKNDMVSSLFFSNKEEKFYTPSKQKGLIDENIKTALKLEPLNNTIDYANLNEFLLLKIKKRSLIFLIGDFLELPDLKPLSVKHELYCVIVRDKMEEDLKLMGEFNFIDTNTLGEQTISLDEDGIKKYNQLIKKHDKALFTQLKKLKIRYKKIYTNDNVQKKLLELLRS